MIIITLIVCFPKIILESPPELTLAFEEPQPQAKGPANLHLGRRWEEVTRKAQTVETEGLSPPAGRL